MAYRMAQIEIWVTFSDLEGYFCCLKLLCPYATVVLVYDGALAVQLTSPIWVIRTSDDNTHGIVCSLCDSCSQCNDACTKLCR